jgi:hypothetical protein
VVVVCGLTFVEPLAAVDAKVPGVIAMLVAPDVAQLSVLIPPSVMLFGLAVNELMEGRLSWVTVTVTAAVAEPVVFVAVRVYVVVTVGLRTTEPLADVVENVPGVTVTLVAPEVVQLSVVLAPAMIAAGPAEKEVMVGAGTSLTAGDGAVQPASPAQADRRTSAQGSVPHERRPLKASFPAPLAFIAFICALSAARGGYRLERMFPGKFRATHSQP